MPERKSISAEVPEAKDGTAETPPRVTHEKLADAADAASKATRVVAGAAAAGAFVAAPTGLTAIGVSLGLVSAPFIVTVAPVLAGVATGAAAISAAASLYSKFKKRS